MEYQREVLSGGWRHDDLATGNGDTFREAIKCLPHDLIKGSAFPRVARPIIVIAAPAEQPSSVLVPTREQSGCRLPYREPTLIEMLTCCVYCELPGDEEGGGGIGVTGLAGVGALGAARTTGAGAFWVVIDVGNGRPCG